MNDPSPPMAPPEKVSPTCAEAMGEGANRVRLTAAQARDALDALEVDLERQHLLAVDPAEAAVGQDDAEPIGCVPIDDREDLAVLGAIELAIAEAGAGAHRRARHDHAQLRIGALAHADDGAAQESVTTTSAITTRRRTAHDPASHMVKSASAPA